MKQSTSGYSARDWANYAHNARIPQVSRLATPAAEAAGFGWFASDELPADLAFDHNRAALVDWQRQVDRE